VLLRIYVKRCLIKSMRTLLLSKFITTLRQYLIGRGFFEQHLCSTTDYKIIATDTFSLKGDLHLRFNPEPDIWQVGLKHDYFFWIGSLFRNEKRIDALHKYEFTVIDTYLPHGKTVDVVLFFKKMLRRLERKFLLKKLSSIPFKYVTHADFNTSKRFAESPTWFVVTDYPIHESFYDTKTKYATKKFEIFFCDKRSIIEVVACGELGDNANPEMFVKKISSKIPAKIRRKRFIGFGIGLERLISIYQNKAIRVK